VLEHVAPADYEALTARAAVFAKDLEAALGSGGLAAVVPSVGPLVGLFVAPAAAAPLRAPGDYEGARELVGHGAYGALFHAMLGRGVALAPGPYEVLFPGMAHDDAVLARVVEVAAAAAAEASAALG